MIINFEYLLTICLYARKVSRSTLCYIEYVEMLKKKFRRKNTEKHLYGRLFCITFVVYYYSSTPQAANP